MAKGHYLVIQDKTTCGGIITEGDTTHTLFGKAIAREQDRVTCGKHPGTYIIVGHIPRDGIRGRKFAGTLHSFSSCPCKARFIPSMLNDTYELSSATTAAANDNHSQESTVEPPVSSALAGVTLVFAKSFQRGAGNTEAGTADEPQNNFATMSFYQSQPAATSPVTNAEPVQHAQAAKKKKPETPPSAPTPKKRSLFDKVSGFFFGEAEAMPLPLPLAPPPVVTGAAAEAGITAAAGGATVKANQDATKALTHSMKRLSGPSVWQGSLDMALPYVVMGAIAHNMLKGQKSDLLTAEKLLEVAKKRGTVPTRVRYNWVEDEQTGRLKAVGYHTSAESGSDQVRVRRLYPTSTGGYEFWEDGAKKPTILWTPDNPGYTAPSDTAHGEQVVLPSGTPGLEIPDIQGVTVTVTPIPEERDFRDYILVFPANEYPPIYIYLSKPPVEFLDVDLYTNFNGRSRQGKYHVDHMPSRAAVILNLKREYPDIDDAIIKKMADNVAAIAIPAEVHRKVSATYGGRNKAQKNNDSVDLRTAMDKDFDTEEEALREHGATEKQLQEAREKMHKINEEQGLYK